MTRRAVVVGAGFGGLAAACHLVGSGWDVEVIERLGAPGGRAGRLERNGFHFDTGPTVLTMPDLLAATFAATGGDMDDHLELTRLDPAYRACFADGSELHVRADRDAMAAEVARVCGPAEAERFDRYCDWLGRLCRLEVPSFLDRNYDHVTDLVRPLGPALGLLRLGALRRLDRVVARAFHDDRLRRLFSFQSLYAGIAPHRALGVLAVIGYMDVVAGVWAAHGGMHAVATGLADALAKAGGRFGYGRSVDEVVLAHGDRGPARGVHVDGEVVAADAVVVNADLPFSWAAPGHPAPGVAAPRPLLPVCRRLACGRPRPSRRWPCAPQHPLRTRLAQGFSGPGRRPAYVRPLAARVGAHAVGPGVRPARMLGALHAGAGAQPHRRARLGAPEGDGAQRAVGTHRAPRLPGGPVEESLVDPVDWARQGLAAGTPFSLSHRFLQSGPFRPSNVDDRAPGLVFVGTGTVPGVGVPMVLLSGRLAAERLRPGE